MIYCHLYSRMPYTLSLGYCHRHMTRMVTHSVPFSVNGVFREEKKTSFTIVIATCDHDTWWYKTNENCWNEKRAKENALKQSQINGTTQMEESSIRMLHRNLIYFLVFFKRWIKKFVCLSKKNILSKFSEQSSILLSKLAL